MAVMKGSLAVLLCACAFVASAGQVYQWIDASGRIHFSDTPRPGWKRLDVKGAPGVQPSSDASVRPDAAADDSVERVQLRAEECQRRREQLATYRNSAQIVERDGLGNERTYTEEERLQLLELTLRQVNELCRAEG